MHLSITAAAWTKSWVCTSNTWWGRLSSKLPGRWELSLLAVKFNLPPSKQLCCVGKRNTVKSLSLQPTNVLHGACSPLFVWQKWILCIYMEFFPLKRVKLLWLQHCNLQPLMAFKLDGWQIPFPTSVRHLTRGVSNTVICQKWKLKWTFFFFSVGHWTNL